MVPWYAVRGTCTVFDVVIVLVKLLFNITYSIVIVCIVLLWKITIFSKNCSLHGIREMLVSFGIVKPIIIDAWYRLISGHW